MALEKEKLQKIVLVGFIAAAVTFVYCNFVISDIQMKELREMRSKSQDLEARIDKSRKSEKSLTLLAASCAEEQPFLVAQEAKIVKGDHVAWFWREMGDFAEKQKMSRVALVPEGAGSNGLPENEAYAQAGASLNINSGYHKLGEFVRDLENSFSTLQIKNIEILGGATSTPETHTVRLQFHLLASRDENEKDGKLAQSSAK